jgi:glycosyltransferase involved in cell wall biosynthesis
MTVLHVLSQRPSLTGSGVTLDALVRHAAAGGWDQHVVVGTPSSDPVPDVGGLPPSRIHPLRFGPPKDSPRSARRPVAPDGLPFQVPGMSDVMPYPSTRFSAMSPEQLARYRACWSDHLRRVIEETRPGVIHAHHVWLVSSLLKDIAPDTPVVVQCHATGLRQMELCPHLAAGVVRGSARNERFLVLHRGHAEALAGALGIDEERIHLVGAGYREDLFHLDAPVARSDLVYVGKYSAAKGLPWLLDAIERLWEARPELELHVAGSGAGGEADELRRRMEAMAPRVVLHGQLAQPELADLLRRSAACVLPSFYEGVPLVLVEALACGCRLVATRLPGVMDQLAPHLGDALELVRLPRLTGSDRPREEDLPAFVADLAAALEAALSRPPIKPGPELAAALSPFTWRAVFERVEEIWLELVN